MTFGKRWHDIWVFHHIVFLQSSDVLKKYVLLINK